MKINDLFITLRKHWIRWENVLALGLVFGASSWFACSQKKEASPFVFLPQHVDSLDLVVRDPDSGQRWQAHLLRVTPKVRRGLQVEWKFAQAPDDSPDPWANGKLIHHLLDALYGLKNLQAAPAASALSDGLQSPRMDIRFTTKIKGKDYPIHFALGNPFDNQGRYFASLNGERRLVRGSLISVLSHVKSINDLRHSQLLLKDLNTVDQFVWKQGKDRVSQSRRGSGFGQHHRTLQEFFQLKVKRFIPQEELADLVGPQPWRGESSLELLTKDPTQNQRLEFVKRGDKTLARNSLRPQALFEVDQPPQF